MRKSCGVFAVNNVYNSGFSTQPVLYSDFLNQFCVEAAFFYSGFSQPLSPVVRVVIHQPFQKFFSVISNFYTLSTLTTKPTITVLKNKGNK